MTDSGAFPPLNLPLPLSLRAGVNRVALDPLLLRAGEWVLLAPSQDTLGADVAMVVARTLASLAEPESGRIELFGRALPQLAYHELVQLRTRLGFIPGSGGLLSARTLRENVALPVSVHAGLSAQAEAARVEQALSDFELQSVADLRPHEVSGRTRFRACAARALMLTPELVVVEGSGEFVSAANVGLAWRRLAEYRARRGVAAVVCLARPEDDFEAWFREQGGNVMRFRIFSERPSREEPHP